MGKLNAFAQRLLLNRALVAVMGMGAGAVGTYLAANHPEMFAAICSGG